MRQEKPLTREELERLERRERQLTWVQAAGLGVLLLAGVAASGRSGKGVLRALPVCRRRQRCMDGFAAQGSPSAPPCNPDAKPLAGHAGLLVQRNR